jgi:GntR family transcriptional regulator
MAARGERSSSAPAFTASQANVPTSAAPPDALVLRVDLSRPVPPYEQLRAQISGLVAGGQLAPGSRLPSVRQLAGDLGLAPGTVARAYSELESAGLLTTRQRGGTFIADSPAAASADATKHRALADAADSFVTVARTLGLSDEAAEAAVRQAIARVGPA